MIIGFSFFLEWNRCVGERVDNSIDGKLGGCRKR